MRVFYLPEKAFWFSCAIIETSDSLTQPNIIRDVLPHNTHGILRSTD